MDDVYDGSSIDLSDSDSRPTTRSLTNKDTPTEKVNAGQLKKLSLNTNKFMENFNPETSARERRKLNRKITTAGGKRGQGSVYDEEGIHLASKKDLCDCLMEECEGCFFPCTKCTSTKCGMECRVLRKYIYESIEYEGCNIIKKNPFAKNKPDLF